MLPVEPQCMYHQRLVRHSSSNGVDGILILILTDCVIGLIEIKCFLLNLSVCIIRDSSGTASANGVDGILVLIFTNCVVGLVEIKCFLLNLNVCNIGELIRHSKLQMM